MPIFGNVESLTRRFAITFHSRMCYLHCKMECLCLEHAAFALVRKRLKYSWSNCCPTYQINQEADRSMVCLNSLSLMNDLLTHV